MRRRAGTGLVRNELRLLLTAADLRVAGHDRFHGYDLARHLADAEDSTAIMSQPTLYRSLRRLEQRGALISEWESLDEAAASKLERRGYYDEVEQAQALLESGRLSELGIGR